MKNKPTIIYFWEKFTFMKSKFPGMDPYLEGADWSDVHNSLAYVIKRQLSPQLSPKYYARLEKYVVTDVNQTLNMDIVYPDLDVWKKPPEVLREHGAMVEAPPTLTPPTVSLPFKGTLKINVPVIKIKDKENNQLITTIEIISPANKRKPGYEKFVKKQETFHAKGVNLLEIDLIRTGKRRVEHVIVTNAHYLTALFLKGANKVDLWAIDIKHHLPVLPVPLKSPDPDAILDLQKVFDEMYEEGGYVDSINYWKTPPPPPLQKRNKNGSMASFQRRPASNQPHAFIFLI